MGRSAQGRPSLGVRRRYVIVIVNDEEPTDHVLFTTDEGLTWREFKFTTEKIRVRNIMTVPEDTSRKLLIFDTKNVGSMLLRSMIAVKLVLPGVVDVDNPGKDNLSCGAPARKETRFACSVDRCFTTAADGM
ncbi:hypothetical protein CY34DRAFT_18826 [Suillus luteus UH-Slu-Lm8-n1]|uniref:Sortilin N-terminal domain-containing protein n=1 Tax=Suillus luteus UH-Slu-Lm8-n1 TaxID=930992 RepID=A0A0C9ZTV1_9AGAM|nr:hypothetical protein CY34DRAFT_18826 [Suillus luteus UH-Slu-Lm8-n1]